MSGTLLRVLSVLLLLAAMEYLSVVAADPSLRFPVFWGVFAVAWVAFSAVLFRLARAAKRRSEHKDAMHALRLARGRHEVPVPGKRVA
jgi:hypothetical protein